MTTGEFKVVLVSQIPHLQEKALRLCGAEADAADLVQSALLRALVWAKKLPEPGSVRNWLRRVLQNLFIDGWRARSRSAAAHESDPDAIPAPQQEPEAGWTAVDGRQLQRAVDRLPPGFRDAYRLHVAGHGYEQIARRLGIPPATVGTRLFRARKRLREILKEEIAAQRRAADSASSA